MTKDEGRRKAQNRIPEFSDRCVLRIWAIPSSFVLRPSSFPSWPLPWRIPQSSAGCTSWSWLNRRMARQANPAMQIIYSAGKAFQFLLPVLCVIGWERRWPLPAVPKFDGLAFGVGFGLLVGTAILGLYHGWLAHSPLLSEMPARLRTKVAEFGMATPLGYLVLAGFISVIHSLLEEYYWRWFVFGRLRLPGPDRRGHSPFQPGVHGTSCRGAGNLSTGPVLDGRGAAVVVHRHRRRGLGCCSARERSTGLGLVIC